MNPRDTSRHSLDRRLAALDPEVPPDHDLWPGILTAIDAGDARRRTARRWLPRLAAGFVLVALAGALFGWQLARMRPPGGEAFAVQETEAFYVTRASLEQTYQQRLALLTPATRHRVEQDLATIRAANADIRKALAADPQSALLSRLLATNLHQEFDLYSTVIRNTAPAVPRSPS